MTRIEVNRNLLIGLAAAATAAVLGLAFVLGRASAGRALPATPAAPSSAHPAAPVAASAPADPALPASPEAPLPLPPPVRAPQEAPARPALPAAAPAVVPADSARAAVAAYFQAVGRIQPGQMGGDPQAMAQGVLDGLLKGDSTGLDGMIRKSEAARASLAALVAPAPCAAYHQASLAALDGSLGLLRSLRSAAQAGNSSALPADFAARAESLRSGAEHLQGQEKQLRERYGLAR